MSFYGYAPRHRTFKKMNRWGLRDASHSLNEAKKKKKRINFAL